MLVPKDGCCGQQCLGMCMGSTWSSCMFLPFIYKILILPKSLLLGALEVLFAACRPVFLPAAVQCVFPKRLREVKSGRWVELAQPEAMQVRRR